MARFIVNYNFHGRCSIPIEASSLEEAQAQVERELESDNFELDADEIDDVQYYISEMHPVTRDGQKIWTNYLRPDDTPGHD